MPGSKAIRGLSWASESPEFQVVVNGKQVLIKVSLVGTYLSQDSSLLSGLTRVQTSSQGAFQLILTMEGAEKEFALTAVSPLGESQRQRFRVSIRDYEEIKKEALAPKLPSPWKYSFGISPTHVSYSEEIAGAQVKYADNNLTGKLGLTWIPNSSRRFLASIGGYHTLASLQHTPADVEPATFYGINARVGYTFPNADHTTIFGIQFGAYFWSAAPPDHSFGVQSAYGPQVFFTLSRRAPGNRSWDLYAKLAALGSSFMNQREYALGGAYQLNSPASSIRIDVTFDIADTQYVSDQASNEFKLDSFSLGVRVGNR